MSQLRQQTLKGLLWSGVERLSSNFVQFVVTLVMARMLTPHDYGVVGMLAVFIAVSQSLVDSGFSQALIRKQDRTDVDNSTVFYFNIVIGVLIYLILFVCAPLIAKFYEEPILTDITRVLSLTVIINSLAVVQRALLSADVDFKTQAKVTLTAALLSGAVGITMAATGFGVWAIVGQQMTIVVMSTVMLWTLAHWHPIWAYSWKSFREMFGFGSKLMLSGLLNTLYNNIYLLIIGKVFSANDLGHYTRAHQFSEFPSQNLNNIITRVSYPVLCKIDDDMQLAAAYRKLIRMSGFIMFPMMLGLAAVAKPLVLVLLTEKWQFASTLLTIICFSMMWYPVHSLNLNLLQVKGRSDLFLKLEIIKKLIGVGILCATVPFGLIAMCCGSILTSLICLVVNTYYTGKLINVGFLRQMRDLMPSLLLSLAMGAVVYATCYFLPLGDIWKLIIGTSIGIVFYIAGAKLLRLSEWQETISIIKQHQ